ncbi:MAG TPA: DNA cytosine methyltransferase, partial [Candidatus Hydrogenedentes bacterium]|nr:DNA cytosine methyltransferase [Candidatus Hydrogenedentota bacterium]
GDLSEMGYDAEWCVLGAHHVGAPHKRDRIWILAYTECISRADDVANTTRTTGEQQQTERQRGQDTGGGSEEEHVAYATIQGLQRKITEGGTRQYDGLSAECDGWWSTEPDVGRVVNGMANRVERLKAIGNGQVPAVAACAWIILQNRITIVST